MTPPRSCSQPPTPVFTPLDAGANHAPFVPLHLLIFPAARPHLSAARASTAPTLGAGTSATSSWVRQHQARSREVFGAVRRARRSAPRASASPAGSADELRAPALEEKARFSCPSRRRWGTRRRADGCALGAVSAVRASRPSALGASPRVERQRSSSRARRACSGKTRRVARSHSAPAVRRARGFLT
jgi:hypothetical protein